MFECYFFDLIEIMTLITPSDNNSCQLGFQLLVASFEIQKKWHPTMDLPLLVRVALTQDIKIESYSVEFR